MVSECENHSLELKVHKLLLKRAALSEDILVLPILSGLHVH